MAKAQACRGARAYQLVYQVVCESIVLLRQCLPYFRVRIIFPPQSHVFSPPEIVLWAVHTFLRLLLSLPPKSHNLGRLSCCHRCAVGVLGPNCAFWTIDVGAAGYLSALSLFGVLPQYAIRDLMLHYSNWLLLGSWLLPVSSLLKMPASCTR